MSILGQNKPLPSPQLLLRHRRFASKLTDIERKLLSDHEGCFKCRTFYAGHRSPECPNGFPNGVAYTPLIEAQARKCCRAALSSPCYRRASTARGLHRPHVHRRTKMTWMSRTSLYFPLSAQNLSSGTVASAVPTTLGLIRDVLIDDGAQVVLIRESLARETGLLLRKLYTPISLGHAFDHTSHHRFLCSRYTLDKARCFVD